MLVSTPAWASFCLARRFVDGVVQDHRAGDDAGNDEAHHDQLRLAGHAKRTLKAGVVKPHDVAVFACVLDRLRVQQVVHPVFQIVEFRHGELLAGCVLWAL